MASAQFKTDEADSPLAKPAKAPRKLHIARPKREGHHPGRFGAYRKFWKDAGHEWRVFLIPCAQGFQQARDTSECVKAVNSLRAAPGVYEFAISKGADARRFKVYVGQSCDIKRRIASDYRGDGGHLRSYFEDALQNTCTVWVRYAYMPTHDAARETESRFLTKYDYAWNQRENGSKRHITVQRSCMCFTSPRVVE